MDDDILRIEKVEYHHWPTCPCRDCSFERERRGNRLSSNSRLMKLSPGDAFALGMIRSVTPCGSLARQLSQQHG
jgi:hypothetical protein